MAKIDIERLKSSLPLETLIERCGVELKAKGPNELIGLCPFHSENTPSFTVTPAKQAYYCMGCGAGGDHLNFLQDLYSEDFKQSAARLQDMAGGDFTVSDSAPVRRESVRQETTPTWVQAVPSADVPPPRSIRVQRDGEWIDTPVVASWAYRDRVGHLHGYTCRVEFQKQDGTTGKDVIPMTWQRNTETGESKLRQGALQKPRLLYGTELLDSHPRANIILVEGEKTADAARRLLADFPVLVVSWPGGGKAAKLADWSLLAGRKIVAWPDADAKIDNQTGEYFPYHQQAGMAAMLTISGMVDAEMRIVTVPHCQWPDGWDLADAEAEGWTGAQVMDFIKNNLAAPADIIPADMPEPDYPEPEDNYYIPDDIQDGHHGAGDAFRILGWDHGRAYYLPSGCSQVVELSAAGHSKLNLLQLAPLRYWSEWFPAEKRGQGVDWDMACDSLIRRAQAAGIWNPDIIRGRGAWFDENRSVVHAGNKVIIDGQSYDLQAAPTKFVYEASAPFKLSMDNPMPNSESHRFSQICESLRWERQISGKLLAGWVFLAPICGALDWRPHVWITGGAGSGKSTILSRIIRPALDGTMVFVQGDTSEAGIRQRVKFDALPVVFDEFESEREKAANRVQDVMSLTTQASSDTGAEILKGGAGGKAESFRIRSMFAFASIGVNMKQHAARTRVTVLSLKTPSVGHVETQADVDQYNGLIGSIIDTLTPDYIARLQARAVRMIPVIRHNARVFSEAAAMGLGTRRMGDQIGTLLAGAYALYSQKEISREQAVEWIASQDWSDVTDANEERDEATCLNQIIAHTLRVEIHDGVKTRTVGELIEKITGDGKTDLEIETGDAADALARIGLRVELNLQGKYELWVATQHKELRRILTGTNYQDSWGRVLLRINGSDKVPPKKFAGVTSRAVSVPVGAI